VENALTGTAYRLKVSLAEEPSFEHPLTEGELVLGRAADCGLALADRFLSRRHARIVRRGEVVEVEDLGSRNGTRLNGRLVTKPELMRPGDMIEISSTVLTLVDPHTSTPLPAPQLSQSIYLDASQILAAQAHARPLETADTDPGIRRAAQRLQRLNQVHEALAHSQSRSELLERLFDHVFDHLGPEEGAVYLRCESAPPSYACAAFRSRLGEAAQPLYSSSLVREVIEKGLAVLVVDVTTDGRFATAESMRLGVRSLVAAPLLTPDLGPLGMIVLNSRLAALRFEQDDLELLISLAAVAALRLRNLTLAEEATERRRLAEEVDLARQIQIALMPRQLPQLAGWELYGHTFPSRGVSGDYYLAIERGRRRELVLMVADVSGKGVGAALLMASLEALCGGPIAKGLPPEEICAEVSPLLFQRTPAAKFATAFLAVLEPASGALHGANAGHNPALVIRSGGGIEQLPSTGPPLGLLEDAVYHGDRRCLDAGDLLVVYSDGIVEAADPAGEEYGLDRLADLCQRHRGDPLDRLAAAVEDDLQSFADGTPFSDDRTLLLLRRSP
jgi:phosphoserine phosphatase RsbU/P